MMVRIIPRLDIKGPNLVKGIHFEGLRVLGKPEDFARYYYENGADELIYMDAVASLYGRNSLLDIVERTAREIFIPLTVGGGLRSLDDIRQVLRAGADKVAINTAGVQHPELIRDAARAFGSSTVMVSIEAIKVADGRYEPCVDYGRQRTGLDACEWALRAVDMGAGEIVVTSIDQEGTGQGFDIELTRRIAESVPVPVIAGGGAGRLSHIHEVIATGKADAVSVASMLHYHCAGWFAYGREDFSAEGNTEFIRSGKSLKHLDTTTLQEIKAHLSQRGIECRGAEGAAEWTGARA
jgi:imidazole glycerol-phosphate synthase subunit HisF